eukprot:g583.t1
MEVQLPRLTLQPFYTACHAHMCVCVSAQAGKSALDLAIANGHTAVVDLLSNSAQAQQVPPAAAEAQESQLGETSEAKDKARQESGGELRYAVYEGDVERVKELLAQSVDVDLEARDGFERTALMYAADKGHVAVAEALLQAKAAPNTQNKDGDTALILAGCFGRSEVAALLLKAKADMTLKDGNGWTVLQWAISQNETKTVVLLLKYDQCSVCTGRGLSPLPTQVDWSTDPSPTDCMGSGSICRWKSELGYPKQPMTQVGYANAYFETSPLLGIVLSRHAISLLQARRALCKAAKEGKAEEVQRLLEDQCVPVDLPDQTGVSDVDLLVSPPYWQAHTARVLALWAASGAAPPKLSKFATPLHYLTSLQDKDLKDAGSKVAKEELKLSEAKYAKLPVALCHSMLPWIEIKSEKVRDDRGLTALEALRQSLLPALRKWARSLGAFLGRYLRDAEPSYQSATCSVYMAEDVQADEKTNSKVALKLITGTDSKNNFKREQASRSLLGGVQDAAGKAGKKQGGGGGRDWLVDVLRWEERHLCLVTPAADYSLNDYLRRRNVSGKDMQEVRSIVARVAHCLQQVHARRLVHGDLKCVIYMTEEGWKRMEGERQGTCDTAVLCFWP